MKSASHHSRRATAALLAALITVAGSSSAFAANVTLLSSDASGTSNFNAYVGNGSTTGWNSFAAPSSSNDYFTGAFVLRTPTTGDNTFAGDSLTVQTGGQLAIKSAYNSTTTVSNLILDGGTLAASPAGGTGGTATLAGAITVNSASFVNVFGSTASDILNVTATLSGSGNLSWTTTGNIRGTLRLSNDNSYSGTLNLLASPVSATNGELQLNNANAVKNATVNVSTTHATNPGLTFTTASGTYNVGALSGSGVFALKNTSNAAIILSVGANNATTAFTGAISGAGSFVKVGTGTMTLSGVNTYTGGTTVTDGTLALGANNAITGNVVLNGGTLNTGTFSTTLGTGTLDLNANSSITLGSGGTLIFANSSAQAWDSFTLSIAGSFVSGSSIQFGTDNTGLTSGQLALISVAGFTGIGIDGSGFLTGTSAVPEPSTYAALAGLATLGFVAARRRRRREY